MREQEERQKGRLVLKKHALNTDEMDYVFCPCKGCNDNQQFKGALVKLFPMKKLEQLIGIAGRI